MPEKRKLNKLSKPRQPCALYRRANQSTTALSKTASDEGNSQIRDAHPPNGVFEHLLVPNCAVALFFDHAASGAYGVYDFIA